VKTRAAVLFESPGRYEVHDVDLDPPTDDEVLVRMVASGLCHSDLHLMTGDQPALSPMCPGHERAGIVEKVGRSVVGLCRGDHVVTSFIPSCGHCRYCAAGRANLCDLGSIMAIGPRLDGTYRMHLDGRDVHQFLTISTPSAWSVVSDLSVWRSLTTCPSKRSAFLVAELAPVLGPPSPPSYTLVTRSL